MAFIDWDPSWSVGNPVIDFDHQTLVAITNAIHDARRRPAVTNAEVRRLLDQLVEYTKRHFAREEAMFEATDYPDAAKHKEMHRKLERAVADVAAGFGREPDLLNLDEVARFLRIWLVEHIARHDNGYRPYLSD